MSGPPRWKESPDSAPLGVADLLNAVSPSRAMTGVEQARASLKIASLGSAKIGASGLLAPLTSKAVALGAPVLVLVTATAAMPSLVRHVRATSNAEAPTPTPRSDGFRAPEASFEGARSDDERAKAQVAEGAEPPSSSLEMGAAPMNGARSTASSRSRALSRAEQIKRPGDGPLIVMPHRVDTPPSAKPADPLVREAGKLSEAKAALAQSPERALRMLTEHDAEYPLGQLRNEREMLVIEALIRLGRYEEAKARRAGLVTGDVPPIYRARTKSLGE